MTQAELIERLKVTLGKAPIASLVEEIHRHHALEALCCIALNSLPIDGKAPTQRKIVFHAAWALEYYFFDYPEEFAPYISQFCDAFPTTTNESAKRHFCNIMNSLLSQNSSLLAPSAVEEVVEACAEWIVQSQSKIAVQIGALEIVRSLQTQSALAPELLPALLEQMKEKASPALWGRMRQWNKLSIK